MFLRLQSHYDIQFYYSKDGDKAMSHSTTDTYYLNGNIIRMFSPSAANGGAFSIAEFLTRPGAGAPPNRHPGEAECFYVISGTFEFVVNGVAHSVGPGGFVRVPDGHPHKFTNTGTTDATMLVINAPGTVHDRFFTEAGDTLPSGTREFPASTAPPDFDRLRGIAERCGIEFVASA